MYQTKVTITWKIKHVNFAVSYDKLKLKQLL